MPKFTVKFELKSFYEDDSKNLTDVVAVEIEADNFDALFEILQNDYFLNVDVSSVTNYDTDVDPIETNIQYVLIYDEDGNEVYRDKDYRGE